MRLRARPARVSGVNATAPPLQAVMQFCFSELSYAPAARVCSRNRAVYTLLLFPGYHVSSVSRSPARNRNTADHCFRKYGLGSVLRIVRIHKEFNREYSNVALLLGVLSPLSAVQFLALRS